MNKILSIIKNLWLKVVGFFKKKDGVFNLLWRFGVIFIAVVIVLFATKFLTSKIANAPTNTENTYSETEPGAAGEVQQ